MTAPAPETCDTCGAAPLELVLYPIAIHYKGSGFYSTDYGKGKAAKKDGGGEGGSTSSDAPAKTEAAKPASPPKKSEARSDHPRARPGFNQVAAWLRRYLNCWLPVTQPGAYWPPPGDGGCGAELPSTSWITEMFSCVPTM